MLKYAKDAGKDSVGQLKPPRSWSADGRLLDARLQPNVANAMTMPYARPECTYWREMELTQSAPPNCNICTVKNPFFLENEDGDDYKLQTVYVVFWPEVRMMAADHIRRR